jgi:uncharacterized protein YkwD
VVAVTVLVALVGLPRSVASEGVAAHEAAFVARIDALRAAHGLPPLAVDPELTAVARRWAATMAGADRIWHNRALPRQVTTPWAKLGENVGVGMTVDLVHDAFVASPTHYRNLVDPAFTRIGVGVVVGRDGALFTAHQFMRPAAVAPRPAAPAPEPPPREPSPRVRFVLEQLRDLDAA